MEKWLLIDKLIEKALCVVSDLERLIIKIREFSPKIEQDLRENKIYSFEYYENLLKFYNAINDEKYDIVEEMYDKLDEMKKKMIFKG